MLIFDCGRAIALKTKRDIMFLRKNKDEEMTEINVTPFIDVMLVLLVIFMTIAPLQTVSLPIELPASSQDAKPDENKTVVISINAEREIFISDQKILLKDIVRAISMQTKNNKNEIIFLQIDKTLPYEDVMNALKILRENGYINIALVGITSENESNSF